MKKIKVGIIGSGGISQIYAISLKSIEYVDIIACASPTEGHIKEFARKFSIPNWFIDYRKMLTIEDIDVVVIGTPNYLHAPMTIDIASYGKHVICVKPLCMNLKEADEMIRACEKAKVKLMYGENLCFTPKYLKLKELCDSGTLGKLFFIKQSSKHGGPPTDWFWDIDKSGGWATMDLGCHAFEFFRWMYKNAELDYIYAEMGNFMHRDRGKGDDEAIIIINFKNNQRAMTEVSWAKKGGFEDIGEAHGMKGVSYTLLSKGLTLNTFSEVGYEKEHYVTEKIPKGWTYTTFEEEWNYGFPQMFKHFIECVRFNKSPLVTGDDGRVVMEMLLASYESAKNGARVYFPFKKDAKKPIDLWLT